MYRHIFSRSLFASVVLAVPLWAGGETKVESNVDSRLTLAFRIPAGALQTWLPAPWHPTEVGTGPAKGANLFVVLVHKLRTDDAEGRPLANAGTERSAALVVPARRDGEKDVRLFVVRSYTDDPAGIPGPYKNTVVARLRRHAELDEEARGFGIARESWEVQEPDGGRLVVRLAYQRSLPVRGNSEIRPHSAVQPDQYRIYRATHGSEIAKSAAAGIDRLKSYQFSATVPVFRGLFEQHELIAIVVNPWYVRDVFVP